MRCRGLALTWFFFLAAAGIAPCLGSAPPPRFAATTVGFSQAGGISYMAIGDVNRDGHPDVVATNLLTQSIYVLPGKGDGTFGQPLITALDSIPFPIALADVNGDGIPDIVAGTASQALNGGLIGQIEVLLGKGDGTFQKSKAFPSSAFPVAVVIADFNGDGHPDIAVEESSGLSDFDLNQLTQLSFVNLQLFLGDGKGGYQAQPTQSLGNTFGGLRMITEDWNHDGIPDLAFNQLAYGGVVVLLGKGDGTFAAPVTYDGLKLTAYNALELVSADLNQDGKLDLVITTGQDNQILCFYGNGDGTFQQPVQIPFHDNGGLAIADFNGDGIPDLAIGTSASFFSFFNTGTPPTFGKDSIVVIPGGAGANYTQSAVKAGPGAVPLIVSAVDLNGDGQTDIVAMDVFNGGITVMINQTALPLAVVSAASGTAALAPESLASGYGASLATSTVFSSVTPLPTQLGGVSLKVTDSAGVARLAPLIYVAPLQINFQIPAGTATGTALFSLEGAPGGPFLSSAVVQAVAPSLFSANSNGKGVASAVAVRVDNKTQAQSPVAVYTCPGSACVSVPIALNQESTVYVSLYGTGFRGPGGTVSATCTVHGVPAPVVFAGAQPEFAGLDQVNISLPPSLAGSGESDVQLSVNGQIANTVTLRIQ